MFEYREYTFFSHIPFLIVEIGMTFSDKAINLESNRLLNFLYLMLYISFKEDTLKLTEQKIVENW